MARYQLITLLGACPQSAEADMRGFGMDSGFDPNRTFELCGNGYSRPLKSWPACKRPAQSSNKARKEHTRNTLLASTLEQIKKNREYYSTYEDIACLG
jgi:hypothetical protein